MLCTKPMVEMHPGYLLTGRAEVRISVLMPAILNNILSAECLCSIISLSILTALFFLRCTVLWMMDWQTGCNGV
jgi:hypothetical protein